MRKKILCISILIGTFISGTLFAGCDGNSVKAEANDTTHSLETEVEDIGINLEYVTRNYTEGEYIYEYRDEITGVHYLVNQTKGGISVRYNADDTIFAD